MKDVKKVIIIFSGPSGAGKTTQEDKFGSLEHGAYIFESITTRSRRVNDKKNAYNYVSENIFLDKLNKGQIIGEGFFKNNHYGLEDKELNNFKNSDKNIAVFVIESKGLRKIINRENFKDFFLFKVYLDISEETQIERMITRGDSLEYAIDRVKTEKIREAFLENKDLYDLIITEDMNLNENQISLYIYQKLVEKLMKEGD